MAIISLDELDKGLQQGQRSQGGQSNIIPLDELDKQLQPQNKQPQQSNYQALDQKFRQGEENLREMVSNIPASAVQYGKDISQVVRHPIQTVKGLSSIIAGGLQKLIPNEQVQEKAFDQVMNVYKDKYGSYDQAQKEAINNPMGFLSDISAVTGISGGLIKMGGKATKSATLGRLGKDLTKASQAIEPVSATAKGLGKGLSKIKEIAPYKKSLDINAVKAAQATGVDLPASALSTAKSPALAESIAAKGFFGQDIIKKLDTANRQISDYADSLVKNSRGVIDPSVAGRNIADAIDKYHTNYIANKNVLYKRANIDKGIVVNPQRTIDYVDAILKDKMSAAELLGSAEDTKYFSSLKKRLSGKGKQVDTGVLDSQGKPIMKATAQAPVNAKAMKSAINELNEKIRFGSDPLVTGNKAKLRKLVATMADDLDTAIAQQRPELADSLKVANDYYKEGISKLNSTYGKSIQKFADAGQYDKIIPAIMKPTTSADDIPRILEIVGEQGKVDIQANLLEDIFKKSKGAGGNFTPNGLNSQLKKFGYDKLSSIFSPDQIKALGNIDKITQSIGRGTSVLGGSQTAFSGRLMAQLGLLFANPTIGVKVLLGDVLASKFIKSATGQKLATTGIKTPKIAQTGNLIMKGAEQLKGKEAIARQIGIATEERQ